MVDEHVAQPRADIGLAHDALHPVGDLRGPPTAGVDGEAVLMDHRGNRPRQLRWLLTGPLNDALSRQDTETAMKAFLKYTEDKEQNLSVLGGLAVQSMYRSDLRE